MIVTATIPAISRPVYRSTLGLNIENAFTKVQPPFWNDPLTDQGVVALGINSFRYPGGTIANYWDWKKGWVQAGVSPISANLLPVPPPADSLPSFSQLVKPGNGIPVFDLNVMTFQGRIATNADDPAMIQDQVNFLKSAQQLGLSIRLIELGNEFYLQKPDYQKRFSDGASYAQEMNVWIPTLKKEFPEAKIAVVGAAYSDLSDPRQSGWNQEVLANIAKPDAMQLHIYEQPTVASAEPAWLLSQVFDLWPKLKATYIDPLGRRGIEAWITEFDLLDQNADVHLAASWFHALYLSEMLIQFLSEPTVTHVDFYNMAGSSTRHVAVYSGNEKLGPLGIVPQAGTLSASGLALAIFGRAMRGSSRAAPLTFGGAPLVTAVSGSPMFSSKSYPSIAGIQLITVTTPQSLIVNFSSQPITVSLSSIGGNQMETLAAPDLSTIVSSSDSVSRTTVAISGDSIVAAPYSINRIYTQ